MKTNSVIAPTRVSTRRDRQTAADRAAIARHQSALAALDAADRTNALIDAIKRQPLPQAGPRTASHPMATKVDPDTRGPQEPATAIPEGGTVATAPEPDLQQRLLMALALTAAVLIGLALGKLL